MNIYTLLATKSHNPHHLLRYCNFIAACISANALLTDAGLGITEKHHICPKADDLFPQFKKLKDHPWNKAILTARQHYLAHHMLWHVYGGSQTNAFWRMSKGRHKSSRLYLDIRSAHSTAHSAVMFARNASLVAAGEHNFQTQKFRVTQSGKQKNILAEGEHNFQNPENMELRKQRIVAKNRASAAEGKHPFQSEEYKAALSMRSKLRHQSPEIAALKELRDTLGIGLPRGWHFQKTEWLIAKIQELTCQLQ